MFPRFALFGVFCLIADTICRQTFEALPHHHPGTQSPGLIVEKAGRGALNV